MSTYPRGDSTGESERRSDLDDDIAEDISGSSGLPEDDPELEGYVRIRDLRTRPSPLRAAIEDAIREWPASLALTGPEPEVLRFIRRDEDRLVEWRARPICLHCTVPGSPEVVSWGERGVLCFVCSVEAERREAEERTARGGRSVIEWLRHVLRPRLRPRPRPGRPRDLVPDQHFLRRFSAAKGTVKRRGQTISWRAVAVEMEIKESTLTDKRDRYGLTLDD